jgi:hypothetical protein
MREFDTPIEPALRKMERRIHNSKLRDLFRERDKSISEATEQPPAPVVSIIENEAKRTTSPPRVRSAARRSSGTYAC